MRARVRARVHLTEEDDGLSVPWRGTVFVNPPYGRTLATWVAKAHSEVESGQARTVVALLPARPDSVKTRAAGNPAARASRTSWALADRKRWARNGRR